MTAGDAEVSNTPGLLLQVFVEEESFQGRLRIDLDLGGKPFPSSELDMRRHPLLREAAPITAPGEGIRLRLTISGHVQTELVLARLNRDAQALANDETAVSLEGPLSAD